MPIHVSIHTCKAHVVILRVECMQQFTRAYTRAHTHMQSSLNYPTHRMHAINHPRSYTCSYTHKVHVTIPRVLSMRQFKQNKISQNQILGTHNHQVDFKLVEINNIQKKSCIQIT